MTTRGCSTRPPGAQSGMWAHRQGRPQDRRRERDHVQRGSRVQPSAGFITFPPPSVLPDFQKCGVNFVKYP